MANSLYNQIAQQNSNSTTITSMLSTLKNSRNPSQLLMSLMNTNPAVKNVINYVNSNGGDARALFYKKAQEMGINPDDILNQLK